jgi:tRNA threonylcarbamoyladenosine modification (KEOPS) complex  Pcc1 subunit
LFFLSLLSPQLLNFGLKESVINVSAENAVEFRFSAWDYYRLVQIALDSM